MPPRIFLAILLAVMILGFIRGGYPSRLTIVSLFCSCVLQVCLLVFIPAYADVLPAKRFVLLLLYLAYAGGFALLWHRIPFLRKLIMPKGTSRKK